ncbi:MAG: DUF362 domain-containing protein [Candidatus Bathyarchaeia archaeon]
MLKGDPPRYRSVTTFSIVYFRKILHERDGVQKTVKDVLDSICWRDLVNGPRIFVKVNLISSEFIPGQCTSPLILDGLLKEITLDSFDVVVGDADLAAAKQCDRASVVWGHKKIAQRYGAIFKNLSKESTTRVKVGGKIIDTIDIPESILNADSIISIPVLKTHCLTGMTCALKNLWGLLPRARHQYHLMVDDAIADINYLFKDKLSFTLVDGTICMEGNGPRTGKPRMVGCTFGGSDPVAIDAFAANLIGVELPAHVRLAEERGIGRTEFKVEGDPFECLSFEKPNMRTQPIFFWEMLLRKTKVKPLFFDTKIFDALAWIAAMYNSLYYYELHGRRYRREVMQTWLGQELVNFLNNLFSNSFGHRSSSKH